MVKQAYVFKTMRYRPRWIHLPISFRMDMYGRNHPYTVF
jgi:hypothetical protein